MYTVYRIVEYYFGEETPELLAVFNTREEAQVYKDKLEEIHEEYIKKYPEKGYPTHAVLGYEVRWFEVREFENESLSDIEEEYRSSYEEYRSEYEKKMKYRKEGYVKSVAALSDLKRTREILAKFDFANDFSQEKFNSVKLELWSVIKENNLPASLFDREYDYLSDGTKEKWSGRERFIYAPITLFTNEHKYFYNFDNYNIDNDIEDLEKWISDNEYLMKETEEE